MAMYDGVTLVIVAASVIRGAWKGFAWQVATILSLVGGYLVALPLSSRLAPYCGPNAPLNRYIALSVSYAAVSLLVYLLASLVRHQIRQLKLGEYDRHLGSVLGGVKGVVVWLALTLALVSISDRARAEIAPSLSGRWAVVVLGSLQPIMPDGLAQVLHPYIETLDTATTSEPAPPPPPRDRDGQPMPNRSAVPDPAARRRVAAGRGPSDPAGEAGDDQDADEPDPRHDRGSPPAGAGSRSGRLSDAFKRKVLPRLLDEMGDLIPTEPAKDHRGDRAN